MQHELQQAALWRKPAASAVLNASAGGCVWKGPYGYENSRPKAAVGGAKPWGDPAATRTQDRLLRRQMLYPAELPDHHRGDVLPFSCKVNHKFLILHNAD